MSCSTTQLIHTVHTKMVMCICLVWRPASCLSVKAAHVIFQQAGALYACCIGLKQASCVVYKTAAWPRRDDSLSPPTLPLASHPTPRGLKGWWGQTWLFHRAHPQSDCVSLSECENDRGYKCDLFIEAEQAELVHKSKLCEMVLALHNKSQQTTGIQNNFYCAKATEMNKLQHHSKNQRSVSQLSIDHKYKCLATKPTILDTENKSIWSRLYVWKPSQEFGTS